MTGPPAPRNLPDMSTPLAPLPGDAALSLRALVAGALSPHALTIRNLGSGAGIAAAIDALRAIGASVERDGTTAVVSGGALHDASATIDCGDSADAAELLLGLCAGAGISATLTGSFASSLEPTAAQLRAFGARIETANGSVPATVHGTRDPQTRALLLVAPTRATRSALIFAARAAGVAITLGGDRGFDASAERLIDYIDGAGTREVTIPGDFAAAAPALVEAVIQPDGYVRIDGVGVDPDRTGFLDVLAAMGARVERENQRDLCGQPVADLIARHPGGLHGATVAGDVLARTRPELDLIARLATHAGGPTRLLGRDLPDPPPPFERLPNGIGFPGLLADTLKVSETTA